MAYDEKHEFWTILDQHRRVLIHDFKIAAVRKQFQNELEGSRPVDGAGDAKMSSGAERRKQVLSKVEKTVKNVFETIGKGDSPVFTFDNLRSWENVQFDETSGLQMCSNAKQTSVRFGSPQSTKKFSLILKVLSIMYRLIQANSFCTKRDIYYQDTVLFGSQSVVDSIVTNISCMLKIPRWELHVLATSKGCVAGDLRFQDAESNYFDCSGTCLLIPSHVTGIRNIETNAKFVIIVEKDATFQKLLDDKLCEQLFPCIMITGKGFPDINTRILLKKLWEEFQIPMFALVDADPHGMEIMAVYRFGSLALAYESHHLTVPAIRWIGIFPSDIERFKIPSAVQIPITTADVNKANDLLKRPYVTSNQIWQHEIELVLKSKVKAEIQSLSAISPRFLSDIYIPGKLQQGGWI